MKFSIATWAFLYGQYADNPWSLEKILDWTAEAGFDGTEFCGFHMPSPEEVYDTPQKCRKLLRLVEQRGLEAACYAAWCREAPPSTSSYDAFMARFEKALRFCVNCRIPVMRLDSGSDIEELTSEEYKIRFDRLITHWRAASRLAASAGVDLVFESEPPMWINKPSEVLAAVEAVNEKNFKLLFDPSHAYLSSVKGARQVGEKEILPGGVIEYIHMMGHHIGYVHMVDTDGELSREDSAHTSTHLPLGEGILDLDLVIDALWPYAGELPYWSLDFYACRDAERTGIESLKILREKVQKKTQAVPDGRSGNLFVSIKEGREAVWENPKLCPFEKAKSMLPLSASDIEDAEARLERFAPFIEKCFPETAPRHGLIESPLTEIPRMKDFLNEEYRAGISGRLFLKQDSHLAISGSVKARGGIYEVLKHTEDIAIENGLLKGDYTVFDSPRSRKFFRRYAVHVGSTGNLGLSIGIMSAAIGYRATVHMSADARQWKKDLLRSRGVNVIEYDADYSRAVQEGRKLAMQDPYSYFVDDENSVTLFLGYAAAAGRLKKQLQENGITVDAEHPLFVYIPCGVGGAPGGITFGLKQEFGDHVFCIFIEPVQAPCMLLGMSTGLHNAICVQDFGLTGITAADGLAVGRPSGFVGKAAEELTAGIVTVRDGRLFDYLRALQDREDIFIEPSACAAFQGPVTLSGMHSLLSSRNITESRLGNSCHIAWATGGSMVPEEERKAYFNTYI